MEAHWTNVGTILVENPLSLAPRIDFESQPTLGSIHIPLSASEMGESFVVRRFFKGFQSLLPSDFYLFYKDLPPKLAGRTEKYTSLERSYGSLAAVIIIYTPVDVAAQHERVERIVVEGKDKDAFAFKQAVTNECSMTAVAVCERLLLEVVLLVNLCLGCYYRSSSHHCAVATQLECNALGCSGLLPLPCDLWMLVSLLLLCCAEDYWNAVPCRFDERLAYSAAQSLEGRK